MTNTMCTKEVQSHLLWCTKVVFERIMEESL